MKFLSCPAHPTQRIKSDWTHANDPVAVDAVKSITRDRKNHYFNEEGFPSVKFEGTDKHWVFENLAQREAVLRLLTEGHERIDAEMLQSAVRDWQAQKLTAPIASNSSRSLDWREAPVPTPIRGGF